MRVFVNPTNNSFTQIVSKDIYVDKTELINFTNTVLGSSRRFICNSRPRRFGKTYTAHMLEYYYCKSFSADDVFSKLNISKADSYSEHLNKYNVIHLDMQYCSMCAGGYHNLIKYVTESVIKELMEVFPGAIDINSSTLAAALPKTGERFIFIIDEWDAPLRDAPEISEEYYMFLRSLFKGSVADNYTVLAYLTGILPIKKEKGQSAVNNFTQYTMVDPMELAPYFGFNDAEVRLLCNEYKIDFNQMSSWYDGYVLNGYHVYNPVSVINTLHCDNFKGYWSETSAYSCVSNLIDLDFDGLRRDVVDMLDNKKVSVNTYTFSNDVDSVFCADHVLTYLIHLGYLAYDRVTGTTFIPNKELHECFEEAVKVSKMSGIIKIAEESNKVLDRTLRMDSSTLGELLEYFHNTLVPVLEYNNENSLSYVIDRAYISASNFYQPPVRELATGKGYADMVFIPKSEFKSEYPALLIELKWNKTANTAIKQIKEKKYPTSLLPYTDNILLVGINYNKDTKKHECVIEKYSAKPREEVDSQKVAGGEWQKKAEEADAEIKEMRAREEKSVLKLANKHLSVEDIADCLSMSVDSVKEILSRRNGGTLL